MGYEVQMECPQTEVGEHGEVGYRSGERLPVGHADVGADWRPVVVEVEDPPPPVAEPKPTPVPPVQAPKTGVTK